ncbi:MAG: NrpR regulatory domain-containing protein [Candidatus Bathyarchaeia archaeon]
MGFDLEKRKKKVIANIATLSPEDLKKALQTMKKVILAGYCVSPHVKIAREGESLGGHSVPDGKVMIATPCSITLDGILHHSGIPVVPRFAA